MNVTQKKRKLQLFLSYTHRDEVEVETLYQKLSSFGFKPWIDIVDILPGENWEWSIKKAIRQSDFFIVCLSANSVNRRGFLQKEILEAINICEEMLPDDIFIIPVRFHKCEVPERLQKYQWVDLFEEKGWDLLIKAIHEGTIRRQIKADITLSDQPEASQYSIKSIQHFVKCHVKDYSGKIEIKYNLLIKPENYKKYKSERISNDLEKWIINQLNVTTQNVLVEKRYIDILLDLELEEDKREIQRELVKEIRKTLESIGFSLKHIIIDPKIDLTPLKLKRDGFIVEENNAIFATLDNRVNVKLSIAVVGKIKYFEKISQYITPDKNIMEEMRQIINNVTKELMYNADPEQFYMPVRFPSQEPLTEKLRNLIEEKLEKEFFAENVTVVVKIEETDLIKRIIKLVNGSPYRFEIQIIPLLSLGHREMIPFEVELLINGIDENGWGTFLSRNSESQEEEVKRIQEVLKKDIESNFQKITADSLMTIDITKYRELLKIARHSHSKIAKIFGLDITISQLSRKLTLVEKTRQKILHAQIENQKKKEFAKMKVNDGTEESGDAH